MMDNFGILYFFNFCEYNKKKKIDFGQHFLLFLFFRDKIWTIPFPKIQMQFSRSV